MGGGSDEEAAAGKKRKEATEEGGGGGGEEPPAKRAKEDGTPAPEEAGPPPPPPPPETDAFGRLIRRDTGAGGRARGHSDDSDSDDDDDSRRRRRRRRRSRSRSPGRRGGRSRSRSPLPPPHRRRSPRRRSSRSRSPPRRGGGGRRRRDSYDERGRGGGGRYGGAPMPPPPPPPPGAFVPPRMMTGGRYAAPPFAPPMPPPPPPPFGGSPYSNRRPQHQQQQQQQAYGAPMSFKEWLLSQPENVDPEESLARYAKYKETNAEEAATRFFDDHFGEEWFQDRYVPSAAAANLDARHRYAREENARLAADLAASGRAALADLDRDVDELERLLASSEAAASEAAASVAAQDAAGGLGAGAQGEAAAPDTAATSSSAGPAAPEPPAGDKFAYNCVFLGSVPSAVRRAEVEAALATADAFVRLHESVPRPHRGFDRLVWAEFESQSACEAAVEWSRGDTARESLRVGESTRLRVEPRRIKRPFGEARASVPPFALYPARIAHDLRQATALLQHLDARAGVEENAVLRFLDAEDVSPALRRLNGVLECLRTVHLHSYYSGRSWESPDEMEQRERGLERRQIPSAAVRLEMPAECPWADAVDRRVAARLDGSERGPFEVPDGVALADDELAARREEAAAEFVRASTQAEDDDTKYRCLQCGKLFRAPEFVAKHLSNKHPALVEGARVGAERDAARKAFMADTRRDRWYPRAPSSSSSSLSAVQRLPAFQRGGPSPKQARQQQQQQQPRHWQPIPAAGNGKPRPPPPGAKPIGRKMMTYNDMDAAAADDSVADVTAPAEIDWGF